MKLYAENKHIKYGYIPDWLMLDFGGDEDISYVCLDLRGETQYKEEYLAFRFKGDALLWEDTRGDKLLSYPEGLEITNSELVDLVEQAKRFALGLNPETLKKEGPLENAEKVILNNTCFSDIKIEIGDFVTEKEALLDISY